MFFATPATGSLLPPAQIGPGNSGDNNRAFLPNDPPVFQWQGVVGAVGYKVRVSEYPYDAANEVLVHSVNAPAASLTADGGMLIPGLRYRWTASALYPAGESEPWEAPQYFEISDPNAPQISSAVTANATRGSAFSYTITATNSPTSYGAADLPEGLSVNAATGVISGTPTFTGAHSVLVKAFNAVGGSNRLVIMDVRPPVPVVTSTGSTSAVLGRPFSYRTVTTENPTSYGATNLTAGLTMDPDSGLITGAVTTPGNYTILLSATNSGGTGTKSLSLSVATGPPYDTKLTPSGVHENQPVGTVVGNFDTLDGDPGQSFSYTLVAGAGADDNALFQIFNGEAALRTGAVFDYETRNTYSIRVRTTDNSGQFLDKQITVRVLNVIGEVQGGLQLSDATVLENQPVGTLVGFLSAVDPDPGETFTFAIAGGVDALKFTVVGNQLRTAVPLDMESKRFHDIRLRVTDSGGNVLEESAIIEALDDPMEDFDEDGLTQAQEAAIGTSDLIADTDGDGSGDGAEVQVGTSPLDNSQFANGTVVAWGDNSNGQSAVPARLSGVVAVAGGDSHSLALKSDGTVVTWGANYNNQLAVPVGLSGVAEIAAGSSHSLVLKTDGTVMAWGDGAASLVPVGLGDVMAIAAGNSHSLVLKTDGTVLAWGSHDYNQDFGQSTVPAGLSGVVAIAAGSAHSVALRWDGTVVAWGRNNSGQCSVPAGLSGVVAVAAGGPHSLALKSDGTVVAWGYSFYGAGTVPEGLDGVLAIAAGSGHSLALKSDGTVAAWGFYGNGQNNVPAALSGAVVIAEGVMHSLVVRSMGASPRLSNESLLRARVGQAYDHQVVATGSGVTYSATNLPPGLVIDSATGIISGTPTQIGLYYVRMTALNSFGRDVQIVRLSASTGNASTDLFLSSAAIGENLPVGTVVGLLSAVDPDIGETVTFSIAGGADALKFTVVGNQIRTAVPLDYELQQFHSVTLRVTDGGGNVLEKSTIIAVLDDTSEDFDGDGLTEAQEEAVATSDLLADTDGDGAGDGVEVIAGTNPLNSAQYPNGTVVAWGDNQAGQSTVPAALSGVVAIAAGTHHFVALKSDGTTVVWGANYYGQSSVPAGLGGVAAVAAGNNHTLALKSDGTVVAWGDNTYGQSAVPAGLSGVVAVAAGGDHTLALKSDGKVVAWGDDIDGQSMVPVSLSGVVGLSAGAAHSLALRWDGTVVAWGYNSDGQSTVPTGLSSVADMAAGLEHSVVAKSDGTVVAWGANDSNQLAVPAGLNGVVAVAGGTFHSLALKSDGKVVAWGANYFGYHGERTVPAGLSGVVAIAAGGYHSLALRSMGVGPQLPGLPLLQGSLGTPYAHQIVATGSGVNYTAMSLPPGLVMDAATGMISGTPTQSGFYYVRLTAQNSAGRDVGIARMNIGVGSPPTDLHLSNLTVIEDQPVGTLVGLLSAVDPDQDETFTFAVVGGVDAAKFTVFGNQLRTTGPLEYETKRFHDIILRVTDSGGNMLEESTVVEAVDNTGDDFDEDGLSQSQEAAIGTSDLIVDADGDGAGDGVEVAAGTNPLDSNFFPNGTVTAWGWNNAGQSTVPGTLVGVVAVAAGFGHSLAVKSDGAVVAWGSNDYGESTLPVGLSEVVAVAAGEIHSMALKMDGTVMAWGSSSLGQTAVPAALSGVLAVAAGNNHSLGLRADGTVVAWGYDIYGQSTVPAGLSGVVAVAAGAHHSLALRWDGTVVAWGSNIYGESTVPPVLSAVVAVACGANHSLAVKADGTVVAWGRDNWGQSTVPEGLNSVVSVAAGDYHSLAVKSDGTAVAWGYDSYGQCTLPEGLRGAVTVAGGFGHSLAVRSMGMVPKLEGGSMLNARLGESYAHQVVAAGSGLAYSATNLPPGLIMTSATGIISGTPTQIGFYYVRLTAQNSAGRDVRIIRMTVSTGSPPTAIGLTSNVVAEDVPVGTVVARLITDDVDANETSSYSLISGLGGANNALFAIVGDTLVTTASLDYESASALSVRVRVTDSGGNILDRTLVLNVLDIPEGETLANWQVRTGIANLGQSTTGDGLTALQKYAFGLDPTRSTSLPVQAERSPMPDGNEALTITFPRAFGGTTNADGSYTYAGLTYRVEWSEDLASWHSTGVTQMESAPAPESPSGYRLVTLRAPPATGDQMFLRVSVSQSP